MFPSLEKRARAVLRELQLGGIGSGGEFRDQGDDVFAAAPVIDRFFKVTVLRYCDIVRGGDYDMQGKAPALGFISGSAQHELQSSSA